MVIVVILQPLKALLPMAWTELGIVIVVIPQPLKALLPMVWREQV